MSRIDLLTKLHDDNIFNDITFVIDGEEIAAHKAILASSCDYFHTMLFGATNEATATRITLNETPSKQFKEIIRFCYLKMVDIGGWEVAEVCKLLSLAHEYQYDSLLNEIGVVIQKQSMINPVSLPTFFDLAVKLNLEALRKSLILYNRIHIMSIFESEEFIGYSVCLVCFIFEYLPEHKTAFRMAFDALWNWKATHTGQEVEQVFKRIRWQKVPSTLLVELIRVMIPETNLVKIAKMNTMALDDPWP